MFGFTVQFSWAGVNTTKPNEPHKSRRSLVIVPKRSNLLIQHVEIRKPVKKTELILQFTCILHD